MAVIESLFPFIGDRLTKFLEKQRSTLTAETVSEDGKGILGTVWDLLLTVMIGYFLLSLVHSAVNDYRARKHKESSVKAK